MRQATREATRRFDRSKINGSPVEPPVVKEASFSGDIAAKELRDSCRTSAFLIRGSSARSSGLRICTVPRQPRAFAFSNRGRGHRRTRSSPAVCAHAGSPVRIRERIRRLHLTQKSKCGVALCPFMQAEEDVPHQPSIHFRGPFPILFVQFGRGAGIPPGRYTMASLSETIFAFHPTLQRPHDSRRGLTPLGDSRPVPVPMERSSQRPLQLRPDR